MHSNNVIDAVGNNFINIFFCPLQTMHPFFKPREAGTTSKDPTSLEAAGSGKGGKSKQKHVPWVEKL